MIFNLKPGAGDGPVGSIAEDFEEPTTINGVWFPGIQWLAADKSPGSRVQGRQAIRSRLNATVSDENGAREKAGLFVCEGVRSFFDYVIVLPQRLFLAMLLSVFAVGSAMAQESCESKAVGKDGKPLAGAAKRVSCTSASMTPVRPKR